jgi:hypothetical protein
VIWLLLFLGDRALNAGSDPGPNAGRIEVTEGDLRQAGVFFVWRALG